MELGGFIMAKIEMGKDLSEYISILEMLQKKDNVSIMKMSVYDGAGVIVDALRDEISSWSGDDPKEGPTDEDRKCLLQGLGISPMEYKADNINVKIGFAGYGRRTNKYKKGVPIPMIARSIIAGTSFRRKYDFVGKVVRKNRNNAIKKMDETLNKEIEKRLK